MRTPTTIFLAGQTWLTCKEAKLQARIKPTALCSAIDKENLIEFLLDSVHYLDIKSNPNPSFYPVLPYESLSSCMSIDKKINEKKMKRNINIDLAILPSHDMTQAVINRQWWLQLYSTIETNMGTQIAKT